jgi:hypothetical protein
LLIETHTVDIQPPALPIRLGKTFIATGANQSVWTTALATLDSGPNWCSANLVASARTTLAPIEHSSSVRRLIQALDFARQFAQREKKKKKGSRA